MSDVRKSVPAKVIASLLILVSVFSLCWQGMAVLRGIDYVLTDSWQDTWEFKELIREREDGTVECRFETPQRAITPGQALVLYDGDTVVGGGRIVRN